MAVGFRSLAPLGASAAHVVTQVGCRSLLAFWLGGGGAAATVTPPVVLTPTAPGWLPRRRSREYEEYLRALAEGREYVPPGAEDEPPDKRPKRRRPRKQPAPPALTTYPAYAGFFVDDMLAQPGIGARLALDDYLSYLDAYRAARLAYAVAELARLEAERRRQDEEAVLVLLMAA
jgi:hypothetical protein